MSPDQLNLARRRLRLGITNVGFWVLTACAGVYWVGSGGAHELDVRTGAVIGMAAVGVQALFDWVGLWLMPALGPTLSVRWARWLRGALGHTLVLAGVGALSYLSFIFTSSMVLAVVIASVALELGRSFLLWMIGGAKISKVTQHGRTEISAVVEDPAFTGGIIGIGPRAMSVLPAHWRESLPEAELAVESRRREWQIANGLPGRSLALVISWNVLGTLIGGMVLGLADRPPTAALLGHACWMTLWTLGSLLVMPTLSRKAVLAADRAASDLGLDPRPWITRFPELTCEDGSPNPTVQTIFYPIPSAALRLQALEHATTGFVAGNLARSNLYYSWATLTLLGRAVHCNGGRPALWVFPPSA